MSAPNSDAESYRRARSFSSDFITIQSRSLRSSSLSARRLIFRSAASFDVFSTSSRLSLVLGVAGSSSRIRLRISSKAAFERDSQGSGRSPTRSSYSTTPSE
jgi:hypothetical protein